MNMQWQGIFEVSYWLQCFDYRTALNISFGGIFMMLYQHIDMLISGAQEEIL